MDVGDGKGEEDGGGVWAAKVHNDGWGMNHACVCMHNKCNFIWNCFT